MSSTWHFYLLVTVLLALTYEEVYVVFSRDCLFLLKTRQTVKEAAYPISLRMSKTIKVIVKI